MHRKESLVHCIHGIRTDYWYTVLVSAHHNYTAWLFSYSSLSVSYNQFGRSSSLFQEQAFPSTELIKITEIKYFPQTCDVGCGHYLKLLACVCIRKRPALLPHD